MLLGSRGRISKVNSQRMTHIRAALPDLSEDTAAETPVGGWGLGHVVRLSVHTTEVQALRDYTLSRFSIIIRLLGEHTQILTPALRKKRCLGAGGAHAICSGVSRYAALSTKDVGESH